MTNHILTFIIFTPLLMAAGVGALFLVPMKKEQRDQLSRILAIIGATVPLVLGLYMWGQFNGAAGAPLQYVERATWIRSLGIEYYVGVDGISVSMVILSCLISFVATIAS